MKQEQKIMLLRIIITVILLIIINIFTNTKLLAENSIIRIFLYFFTYLFIGFDIFKEAIDGIKEGEIFDENFLMLIATLGAIGLAFYEKSYDFNEAIFVMLFYRIGEYFEEYAVNQSRDNISALMDIRPDYANIEENGILKKVDPNSVEIGTIITINPGEIIPIDGIIESGSSTLNTSSLTGESKPRDIFEGDTVLSGCINITGVIKVRTTKPFGDSTASKILTLVEENEDAKSKSETFITRFAKIYTPTVCILASLVAIIPPIISYFAIGNFNFSTWLYRALIFLVVSCPCALVISIPLSFFAGIGCASKYGILIKGSNYLENLTKTKVMAFDKTGTLTKGVFEVDGIHHSTIPDELILEYAALAESPSSHPISKSIQKAYGKEINRTRIEDAKEIIGEGMIAKIDGKVFACGNSKLMDRINVSYINCHEVGTIVHCALNNEYVGHILIRDVLKPNTKEAIRRIKECGIEKTIMLTGDDENVAVSVSECIGMDSYYAQLLPENKLIKVENEMNKLSKNELLSYVGDGVNDAPVLTKADVGLAMGALGSDAAIQSADIVLMDDDLLKISKAINISKKCLTIVYENIVFAIGVKVICLVLSFFGITNMYLAIFADVGVMVLAVLNALRALNYKK